MHGSKQHETSVPITEYPVQTRNEYLSNQSLWRVTVCADEHENEAIDKSAGLTQNETFSQKFHHGKVKSYVFF
jgi:hypothetical protein